MSEVKNNAPNGLEDDDNFENSDLFCEDDDEEGYV